MKLFLSATTFLLVFSISFTSFAQKARVLLAYNAFNSDKDTLEIGDTLSYNSENLNELIFLKENAYLALMNENGSILEWKNKNAGSYKIEFDESDDGFNRIRRFMIKDFSYREKNIGKQDKKNIYFGMKKTGAVSCPPIPRGIDILAESKSSYLKDSLQIFIEYTDDYIKLKENEKIDSSSLKIEIRDLRNNIIYSQKLDTTFFLFNWDDIDKDSDIVLYTFSIQTTHNTEYKSFSHIIKKQKKELIELEKYFQNKEKTAFGTFLQFLHSCEDSDLNIYSCQLYHNFLKELPKEAHSIIPSWEDYKKYYDIGMLSRLK